MQNQDGSLTAIDQRKFREMFTCEPVGSLDSHAPVVREGDVFRIRGCYFRVTMIRLAPRDCDHMAKNRVVAVGITKKDYDTAKGMFPK